MMSDPLPSVRRGCICAFLAPWRGARTIRFVLTVSIIGRAFSDRPGEPEEATGIVKARSVPGSGVEFPFVGEVRTMPVVTMSRLLDQWEQFVGFVEDGYDLGMDEYRHDLTVRRSVERAVTESGVPEWCLEKLREMDARFAALLVGKPIRESGDVPWWEAGVPRYAGEELAADIRGRYGLVVEVR